MNLNKNFFYEVLISLGIIFFVVWVLYTAIAVPRQMSDETRVENILDITKQLPHSPLRNNLLSVIAAEYGGCSSELYILVNEFNKLQIEKLQKNETRNLYQSKQ